MDLEIQFGDVEEAKPQAQLRPGQSTEVVSAAPNQEQLMIENFCEIVRSGKLDESWPSVSIDNQRICDALDKSARNGKVVEIN